MSTKKDPEGEKNLINKIISNEAPKMDRGVELLLRRRRRRKKSKPKTFQIKFSKIVSFLHREIHVSFDFSFDIKKISMNEDKQC